MKALLKLVIMTSIVSGLGDMVPPGNPGRTAWAAPAKRPARLAPAQQKQLKKASDLYDARQFDQSIDVLTDLLQKQPDLVPAKVILLRCLYQQKKLSEVYRLGQSIEIELLDPDVRYEFAHGAFKENDFKTAYSSFASVPEGHPNFDLAGYHGGISAFKIDDFEAAITLLRQAVVLPSKFLRSHKFYLKEAEKQLLLKQKQDAQKPSGEAQKTDLTKADAAKPKPEPHKQDPQTEAYPPTLAKESAPSSPPALDEPKRDASYRFLKPTRSLSLSPQLVWQEHENSYNKVSDHTIRSGELRLSLGGKSASSERAPQFFYQLHTAIYALEGASGQLPVLPDARQEQFLLLSALEGPRSMIFTDVHLGIEWPMAGKASAGLQGGSFVHSVEFFGDATLISPWLGIFYATKGPLLELALQIDAYFTFFDGAMRSSHLRQNGRLSLSLPKNFLVGAQAEAVQYSYDDPLSDGPDWLARALAELGYQLDDKFKLFFGGFYEQSYRLLTVPAAGRQMEYAEDRSGVFARSELELLSFLRLGLLAQNASMDYSELGPNPSENEALFRPLFIQGISHFAVYANFGVKF